MIYFEQRYFQKLNFDERQIKQFIKATMRDLKIASESQIPEVIFKFSYDAFIKLGIAVIAKEGYKVRSVIGHHTKIIEKLSEILKDEEIAILGNKMRQARNFDFYEGGTEITEKDSNEYYLFVQEIARKAVSHLET